MSLLQRVVKAMDHLAPLSLAETAWDNVGVLVEAPFPRQNANRIFLTIDLTTPVLEEALKDPKVGVIMAYHPPLFRSFKRLTLSDEKQAIALKCAASGISVYSPHTSLDNCRNGINDWLASGLGNGNTTTINAAANPPENQQGAGSGRLHALKEKVPLEQVVHRVKKHLNLPHLRLCTPFGHTPADFLVEKIAICAGSGGGVLNGVDADLYLTGEMGHHEVLAAAEKGRSVILCEHTNTERGYLSAVLRETLLKTLQGGDDVDIVISSVDRDPLVIV
ncbi:NGG1 interacting factor [Gaertneriomyces sp. JEL0708]|nr:NGG1 interacting factor [Gaertneriomyces sp. JEL0708]